MPRHHHEERNCYRHTRYTLNVNEFTDIHSKRIMSEGSQTTQVIQSDNRY